MSTAAGSMPPREVVRRCLEFRDPPRIGRHFLTDPLAGRVWRETDFASVGYAADPRFDRTPGRDEWTTEWGIRRRTITGGIGEAVEFPLAGGWHLLDSFPFPDLADPARHAHMQADVGKAHARGLYVVGHIPSLMLLPMDLRGMENWLMDNALEQENLARLLDALTGIRLAVIDRYAEAGVDGVITWDDMGTNERGFVRPETFRGLYLPRYRRAIDRLHEHGMHFFHHCCGQVREYMEMFVEAGCDALQLDQPELMGIDWLGRNYGGRICFWNCVDIQRTMGKGDLAAIEEEARRQVVGLGGRGGGFMVKAYQQPESIGVNPEEIEAQYRAFKRHGTYPLARPMPAG